MTREEIRRLNGEQYVRLTCLDGAVFEGEATHDSADYCFHEFGRDEEAVEIDHWVFYLGDIVSIELAEPREVGRWMSRPLHRMHLDPEAFAAMDAGRKTRAEASLAQRAENARAAEQPEHRRDGEHGD